MKNVCNICEGSSNFHEGLKGRKSDKSKIMFIAHKPDERVLHLVLPIFDSYEVVLSSTKTGKNMGTLLNYCDLSWDDLFWTNLFKCVLNKKELTSKKREPTSKEYIACFENYLKNQIKEFNPKYIVALGSSVYRVMFPESFKEKNHSKSVGKILFYEGFKTLIYPHPQKIRPPYCTKIREKELFNMMKEFLQ